jgi:hypothetical protein
MRHPYTLPIREKFAPFISSKTKNKKIQMSQRRMVSKMGMNMGALKTPVGKSYWSASEEANANY